MKLFVLLPRVPYPTEKGDKLRAFHQLKQLSKNHEVILCALNDGVLHEKAVEVLSKYASEVHIINLNKSGIIMNLIRTVFSDKPFQVGYFYSKSVARKINAIIKKHKPDHIFCQLIRVAEYVKDVPVPKTLDYQDVFSKGVERRIENAPFYMKPLLKMEYQRVLKYEHDVYEKFDNKIIISIPDRDLIPHDEREKIVVVRNGVDTGFFQPLEREKDYDLVFTGNMGYPPNINAAEYLVNLVLPLVRQKRPDASLLIAGASPHLRVSILASSNVSITGWVPDMRECYASARIFIAPMQIGTGLQNKLLEAMAMGIPSVTSPLANQALQAKPEEEIMIASNPREFADAVIRLLDDKEFASKIAANGLQYVKNNFSWEAETGKILELIQNSSK